ncbi:MAG: sigma-70 family RNA polymerase sigma factor [Tannerella sp.]|jgi:RNA polymerase sigma-70 factor (ECF subfamily)|nr:sigma-70 family RNA polymerase sigma factor [Tannerella sp.]
MDYRENIAGLQKGSYKDFKVLYDAFAGKLAGFVFGLVKSESLTKDIVQETFIKIWINRKNIDVQQSFKAYLFKIAQNLIIDHFRKQMNDPVFENYLDYSDEIVDTDEAEQKMDFDAFSRQLEMAKTKLTARQKELFELNKEQGMPIAEIAQLLNITEQTIYNQLSSALKILRKEIGAVHLVLFLSFFG